MLRALEPKSDVLNWEARLEELKGPYWEVRGLMRKLRELRVQDSSEYTELAGQETRYRLEAQRLTTQLERAKQARRRAVARYLEATRPLRKSRDLRETEKQKRIAANRRLGAIRGWERRRQREAQEKQDYIWD